MAETVQVFIDRVRPKLAQAILKSGAVLWCGTLVIVVAEFLLSLKDGAWPKWVLFSLIGPLLPLSFLEWLQSPQHRFGLHRILQWIVMESPIVFVIMVLAVVCTIVGVGMAVTTGGPRHLASRSYRPRRP
jgi:hypothetical protein